MKSIEERLAASDPAAGSPYVPADFDAMITRVLATPRPARDSAWRAFKFKVGGSVVAASLLTGLGISALGAAGPSLPVLGFAAAVTHPSYSTAQAPTATGMFMRLNVNYQFTGGGGFSTQAGSGEAFTIAAPTDGQATLSKVASVLGIDAGPPATSDHGQSYTSSGPAYAGWLVKNQGYASWGISSNSTQPVSAGTGPSVDALKQRALSYAHRLDNFPLGAATLDTMPGDPQGPTNITVPILVNGLTTDFAYTFSFAADGTLVSAGGESFRLQSAGTYPLVSPSAGVSEITAQLGLANGFRTETGVIAPSGVSAGSSGVGSSPPGATGPVTTNSATPDTLAPPVVSSPPPSDAVPPDSRPVTDTTVPAPTVVSLTDVSSRYGTFTMSDGSTKLLPIYVYVGTVAGDGGYQVSFRVVPIDPTYLDFAKAVQNH